MTPRRCFFSPELALALDPARARDLFDALGVSGDVAARALWERTFPAEVADVVDELALLGTALGQCALVEAAQDVGMPHEGWLDEVPVDLAAGLLATRARTGGALLERVLERAHVRLGRTLPERMAYERLGRTAKKIGAVVALEAALRDLVGARWSEVWTILDDEGVLHAALLHALPPEADAEVDAAAPCTADAPRRRVRRVVGATLLRIDVPAARLTVAPARPQMLDAIAAAVGRALFDDPEWFDPRPAFTLKPLQILGAGGLAKAPLPAGVRRGRAVGCQLDTGRGHRKETRGPDALAEIEADLRSGGYLVKATLRFEIDGAPRPVDAVIELPGRVGVRERPFEREARAAMAALGVLDPGAIADDVVTLAPWEHAEWRWAGVVGADGFAALVAAKLLVRVEGKHTRRVASAAWRRLGRSYVTFPLRHAADHGASYAVAEDWSVPSTTVRDRELVMWRLDVGALLAKMRGELGLTEAKGGAGDLPPGVRFVGEERLASGAVRVYAVMGALWSEAERAAVGRAIARAAGFARPVVLVPSGRRMGRDFVEIELSIAEQLGAKSVAPRLAEIAAELGVEDEIEPGRFVEPDVRLVFHAKTERAWLDGILLTHLGQSGFAMLLALARRAGEAVPTKDVERAMSPNRPSEGAAKAAAKKLGGWVEASCEAAGKTPPPDAGALVTWVPNRGWRLAVKAVIR